jgi:hypothetical protein
MLRTSVQQTPYGRRQGMRQIIAVTAIEAGALQTGIVCAAVLLALGGRWNNDLADGVVVVRNPFSKNP